MPPGRPKIYLTSEEKTLANRAKCKRSYHKLKEIGCTDRPRPAGTGRPRIYKTPEEKVLANRAKSKRNYHKQKAAIGSRRAVRYRAENTTNRRLRNAVQDRVTPSNNPVDIPGWMALVRQTSDKFNTMVHGNIKKYMEELHRRFLVAHKHNTYTDVIIKIETMESTIKRCQDALLQLSGIDNNFREAEVEGKKIKEALSCLEDVLCALMEGETEFFQMYKSKEFMYQSL
ncbi:hypothetical protein PLEOSDRAFT_1108748 [Pleurotus ostreatus PC15]|uniref:Uncharacterized protein n=1 Tax=Pleurotus ostreatus (strain PC15) TaxID=1137138 RepID=A0A067N4Z8_PLEO1|nr:hypothetical protein PLEOSDRAFT_1108748 [Pleurotus ostreatus PC15]